MSSEAKRQTIQRFLDAVERGDADTLYELFASDATWTVHGEVLAGTHTGRDAIF